MQKVGAMLEKIEEAIYVLIIVGGTFLLFINVVLRYFFNSGIIWSEELVRYAVIWLTFLAIGYGVKKDAHVKIDILSYYIPKKVNDILFIIVEIISVVFCVLMVKYSLDVVLQQLAANQLTPSLQIPFYIVVLSLPIGFFFGAIRYIQNVVVKIREVVK